MGTLRPVANKAKLELELPNQQHLVHDQNGLTVYSGVKICYVESCRPNFRHGTICTAERQIIFIFLRSNASASHTRPELGKDHDLCSKDQDQFFDLDLPLILDHFLEA